MQSNTGMRFLIIGCGSIGKRHIDNLLTLNEKEIIAFDTSPDRRKEIQLHTGILVADTLIDAWKFNPDVAFITAPTSMHIQLSLAAAEHKCHLFIEKPLSHRLEGIDDLLDIVQKENLITLVGCNMRFHPGLIMIKKLIDEGAIGNILAMRVEFGQYLPDWHPRENYRNGYSARSELGGGIILDAIHEIDYIRWMLGEVDSVACTSGRLSKLDIDTEDTAALLLRFSNGAIGEIHVDYIQRAYSRTCHVIGEEGTIRWDYTEGKVSWYSSCNKEWRSCYNPPGWEPNHMYVDELRHFLNCLNRNEYPCLDVFEAAHVLRIAIKAKKSAKEGEFVKIGK